ncbi:glutathione transferase GstA (plasmid) [Microvirga ossetica]|uniref:Glutathione transferase GstA n=1 Tax=Microvirga ossetica TaxID=1882682 RepID=A0A1B2ESB3_9HYPH|nr:glutathione transferase GstA [Microvirga ossetica]ANY82865.1 glutathione transferase GstA [Microvirga ossetica]
MKLYYASGTCSLSPHIVAREADIPLELERVDIRRTPHVTATGIDFTTVNPNSYVPALRLDDGSLLTEGAVIVQYLADLNPASGLVPPAGTPERYRVQSWLTFIATELHKMYSPWLFHPEYGAQAQGVARDKIAQRLAFVEDHLAASGPFVMGDRFCVADAYLFTIVGWSGFARIDLSGFPHLRTFMERIGSRRKVREAIDVEGLKAPATLAGAQS